MIRLIILDLDGLTQSQFNSLKGKGERK